MLKKSLIAKTDPRAGAEQIFCGYGVRITYLTPRLIRVEKSGNSTDLASFAVWFRKAPAGMLKVTPAEEGINAETEEVIFNIRKGKPYSVYFKDTEKTAVFSKQKNLKGTTRTLDGTFGSIKLDDGLITEDGAYLFNDSKSMLIDGDGHFIKRAAGSVDYYAFAYGKDYRGTLQAFYKISSPVPIVPRFALGVWWSRYHAYTQKEYLELMARFKKEDIPLTVATIDMDWHWVKDIKKKFGVDYGGWTGYSWNTALFPDYKEFLKKLKDDNLHITVNLHPADGVHSYEDMYEEMAKAVGIDPKTKKTVEFRCGSDEYWNAYFDVLHKPYERDGVDFWWIDWQQGKSSEVPGLDPLNALNHYHYLDNAEDGRMPLILSRYAGFGAHRYPLGFSGDTETSWRVLKFQPYFTATATNAAYSWWSHDIGGHHFGYRDDDLYMRWVQFGVFSPVLRLHSTSMELLGKEPWKFRSEVYRCASDWLRLRHRMIPYLFTMDRRTHSEGLALCEPMYYAYPETEEAYSVPNQYLFGGELIVCPITERQHKENNFGSVEAWLPEGRYTDLFTGRSYNGNKKITLFRELESIPVLAKDGTIIPLSADGGNRTDNPESFEIWAVSGNGSFTLVEDNGKTDCEEHTATTKFEIEYADGRLTFKINGAEGDLSVIPKKRNYKVKVIGSEKDGEPVVLEIKGVDVKKGAVLTAEGVSRKQPPELREEVICRMSRWQAPTEFKRAAFRPLEKAQTVEEFGKALKNTVLPKPVALSVSELIEIHRCEEQA
ncbi:MAG: DUF5110 domain-containing protein [Eubacterium sp.]|nr:DUF5110 domain-containing protein [Eubacterium sp.]